MSAPIKFRGVVCKFFPETIKIVDSQKIKCEDAREFCDSLKQIAPYRYKRTVESWTRELVAHCVLRHFNLFLDHVTDTDLDENEAWWRLVGYEVIYAGYLIWRFGKKVQSLWRT